MIGPRPRRRGRVNGTWAAAGLALLLAGCAADAPPRGELHGTLLGEPLPRPSFTMTDMNGQPYAFAERTAGKLTFLFFGYTYCPDICPIHMANLAAALQGLSYEDRQRIAVVFVTVDPERDTPERLREWLGNFDPGFVGLRGTADEANAVATRLMLPASIADPAAGENYAVGHPAAVVAFSPAGPAEVMYPFGTRREDWVHDLPLLLGYERAGGPARAEGGSAVRVPVGGGVTVKRAFVTPSRMAGAAALYAVIENAGGAADELVGVDAPTGRTELHETMRQGEGAAQRVLMRPVAGITVPAGGTVRLAPGGYHVMLLQPALAWQPGDTVPVRFRFASGAVKSFPAAVVGHAEVEQLLDAGGGR